MSEAWGGFSNGQIPLSAMRMVAGQYFEPDMADRMEWLVAQTGITCQEGYRPLGVPADQYVRNESQTSTGGSNQWFQWGRYQRGETPSAGVPGTSSHGWGKAADITPGRENAGVRDACAKVGLVFTVASESWHVAAVGTPTVDYKKTRKKKPMIAIQNSKTGAIYTVAPGFIHHVGSPDEWVQVQEITGPALWKDTIYFNRMLAGFGIPADKPAAVMGGKTWVRPAG